MDKEPQISVWIIFKDFGPAKPFFFLFTFDDFSFTHSIQFFKPSLKRRKNLFFYKSIILCCEICPKCLCYNTQEFVLVLLILSTWETIESTDETKHYQYKPSHNTTNYIRFTNKITQTIYTKKSIIKLVESRNWNQILSHRRYINCIS